MLSNKCISCGVRVPVKDDKDVPVCDNCSKLYFSQVKKYIREKGSASIDEMNKKLGIPIPVLEKFLDDDRLFDPAQQQQLRAEKSQMQQVENQRKQKEAMLKQMLSEINGSSMKTKKTTPEIKKTGQGMHFINTENNGGRRR